jgi:hypothetical protein
MPTANKNAIRRYSSELDFVYLNPRLAVCKAPTTALEAERLSLHFQTQHPDCHLVIDCTPAHPSSSDKGARKGKGKNDGGCRWINKQFFDNTERYVPMSPVSVSTSVCVISLSHSLTHSLSHSLTHSLALHRSGTPAPCHYGNSCTSCTTPTVTCA